VPLKQERERQRLKNVLLLHAKRLRKRRNVLLHSIRLKPNTKQSGELKRREKPRTPPAQHH
jgi:hypothetical protein